MGQPLAWGAEQLFGVKPLPAPIAPPDPEVARKAAEEEAKQKNIKRKKRLKRFGRQSTFATSPSGIGTAATLAKKTLLGQ